MSNNEWENFNFIEQQLNTLKVFIESISNKISDSSESLDSFESSESADIALFANNDDYDHRFNSAEIDLFDFLYDNKSIAIDDSIELADKNTYIRDVHLFIDRVEDMTRIRDSELMRNNLYICFREIVIQWYNSVFINDQKLLIKLDEDIEQWVRLLLKRFKESSQIIMNNLVHARYTMKNARR